MINIICSDNVLKYEMLVFCYVLNFAATLPAYGV